MTIFHKSCGLVVYYESDDSGDREYLLLQYPQRHWDFVKGHVEDSDKDEIDTAKRELSEETAIEDCQIVKGFMHTISYNYKFADEEHSKTVDFFLCKVDTQEVKISHEHRGYLWLKYTDALRKVTFDNAKDVLVAAESFLGLF